MKTVNSLNIAIAGMGLIGGSLGLALKHRTAHTVIGIDRDSAVIDAAVRAGAADKTGIHYLDMADVLVIALAPEDTVTFLKQNADRLRPGTIVTDVCGIKRMIMEECVPICRDKGLNFVGGHPMAGRERGGFANADPGLFEGAHYILTPPDGTPPHVTDIIKRLAMEIGCAGVNITTADKHDSIIAFTSQLPHVLAYAYVKSPSCPEHHGYSAGSYRDVSRVAASDERLWARLFLQNSDNLCREIDTLTDNLKKCRDAVASGDLRLVREILREGRVRKESVDG